MANKFKSGHTYIVRGKTKFWYVVKQTGTKSWKALMVSHVDAMAFDSEFFYGNGVSLWQNLEVSEHKVFTTNATFRKALFNVLKYGKFSDEA